MDGVSLALYVSSSQMNVFGEASPNLHLCILPLPMVSMVWMKTTIPNATQKALPHILYILNLIVIL